MKYKNISSAIHNFGHSFTSFMNYIDDGFIIDDLRKIHIDGKSIEIDWITGSFSPAERATPRIRRSILVGRNRLKRAMSRQKVDVERLTALHFYWPAGRRKYMVAVDDRDKEYKIYVGETK